MRAVTEPRSIMIPSRLSFRYTIIELSLNTPWLLCFSLSWLLKLSCSMMGQSMAFDNSRPNSQVLQPANALFPSNRHTRRINWRRVERTWAPEVAV